MKDEMIAAEARRRVNEKFAKGNTVDSEAEQWGGWPGFRFSDELTELFNTVSKANALFIKLTDAEFKRWGDYGEDPEHFWKGFTDAMEYNTKTIEALSDYAAELVKYEMYERFK